MATKIRFTMEKMPTFRLESKQIHLLYVKCSQNTQYFANPKLSIEENVREIKNKWQKDNVMYRKNPFGAFLYKLMNNLFDSSRTCFLYDCK